MDPILDDATDDTTASVTLVPIRHKESGGTGTCPEDALPIYEARGYERISDAEAEAAAATPAGPFLPSDHTAREVKSHLSALDTSTAAGSAEFDRIVAAEREGQDRGSAYPASVSAPAPVSPTPDAGPDGDADPVA